MFHNKIQFSKDSIIRMICIIVLIIVAVVTLFNLYKIIFPSEEQAKVEQLTYSDAITMIQDEQISEIQIDDGSSNEADLIDKEGNEYEVVLLDKEIFKNFIQEEIEAGQEIKIVNKDSVSTADIMYIIFLLFIAVMIFRFYKMIKQTEKKAEEETQRLRNLVQKGDLNNDTINQKENKKRNITPRNITFKDIAGLKEEKFELEEVVDFLKNPQKYKQMGAKIPKGILLSGAPGTGKTLLAKALAGEAGVAFLPSSGAEFVEKYVGVGARRIRALFEQARKEAPCIIFIDEIDAIGSERNSSENTIEHNQTLEQLLIEMDGFESSEADGIVVVAATNRIESLDKALLRPGRFDRQIVVSLPDVKGREEILKIHARNKKFEDSVDFKKIAYNTSGFSGAQLENLLNEASIMAVRNKHEKISNDDIDSAMKKIVVGLSKNERILSENERRLVAYHETGHAVVSMFMQTQDKVKEISIIGAGVAGGYTWYEATEDRSFISKTMLQEKVISLLGGRAAEKLFIQDISTGASDDLKRATDIITKMIAIYGMDDVFGPISMNGEYKDYLESDSYSHELVNRTKELLCEAEKKATRILKEHSFFVEKVAQLLLEKETIQGEELDRMFSAYQNARAENIDA